jgi:hypothetical protein
MDARKCLLTGTERPTQRWSQLQGHASLSVSPGLCGLTPGSFLYGFLCALRPALSGGALRHGEEEGGPSSKGLWAPQSTPVTHHDFSRSWSRSLPWTLAACLAQPLCAILLWMSKSQLGHTALGLVQQHPLSGCTFRNLEKVQRLALSRLIPRTPESTGVGGGDPRLEHVASETPPLQKMAFTDQRVCSQKWREGNRDASSS